MKKKILEILASIQGLQILEVAKDYYWHRYEGSIADVQGWIWVSHATSRSVQAASTLRRKIEAELDKQGFSEGLLHQTPKWKDDFLHLGVVSVSAIIGKEYGTHELHCTDPEIANLKSENAPNNSFTNGHNTLVWESHLTRAIVIVVCPDPAIHQAKETILPRGDRLERLKIPRKSIEGLRQRNIKAISNKGC